MDPDYELPEAVKQEAKERCEREKAENVDLCKSVINVEFKKEIESREKQLEQIQIKLARAAKTLHLLRYVLVNSFYVNTSTEYQQAEDERALTDPQNRLHPAIKKLVTENRVALELGNRRKSARMKAQFSNIVIQESEDKTLKQKPEVKVEKLASEVCEKVEVKAEEVSVPRNRAMVKRRIVVGNISKWMPSENLEDNSTHKWMVYVSGPKENPKVDDFVEKVIFYLHPSYQPNDVIELKGPPFHLTRRGWGEFPLRVQIFFRCTLNKPIDIIHSLKLDRTYTGRQTFGNETVADLTIYTDDLNVNIKTEIAEEDSYDRNFDPLLDHNYALKNGVEHNEEDLSSGKRKRGCPDSPQGDQNEKRVKCDKISKVELPQNRFKNVLEALPYILKQLPLVSDLANNTEYKCTYPYVATSFLEYSNWPLEKKLSSEWLRAKAVQRTIYKHNLDNKNKWTVKRILAYARAHGFTKSLNYNMLKSLNYYSEYVHGNSANIPLERTLYKQQESDVDITRFENEDELKPSKLRLVEPLLVNQLRYVKQAAFDAGVLLKPEEVIPGVMYTAAQRVLLKAAMCLAENLIRGAQGIVAHRDAYCEEDCEIKAEDIREVLLNHRPEYKLILNVKNEYA